MTYEIKRSVEGLNPLTQLFIETDFDDAQFIAQHYEVFSISFFDHVLTEKEYVKASLVCYADVKNNPIKKEQFNNIAKQFNTLYNSLYEQASRQAFVALHNFLVPVISSELYQRYIDNALKERPLCCLLFPSLGCFIRTGYDLTHQCFIAKDFALSSKISAQHVKSMVIDVGLNILQR